MDTSAPYLLHSVIVVVMAEEHEPTMLSPRFLAEKEIVPNDWKAAQSITNPFESAVRYEKAMLKMSSSRFEVEGLSDGSFKESYAAHSIVADYVSKMPHTPYRSLGLNCRVLIRADNPEQWLSQRFLCPNLWRNGNPEGHIEKADFTVPMDDGLSCEFSFTSGNLNNEQSESEKIVVVTVNIDHPGALNTGLIREAIRRWPKRQELIRVTLDKILRSS